MKRIIGKYGVFLLVLVFLAAISAGCGSTEKKPQAAGGSPIKEQFVGMGTSSSGGLFNTLGVAMSQLYSQKIPGVKFSTQVTGGSGENCLKLGDKKLELAIVSGATAYEAMTGEGQFKGRKITNMRAITNLYPAIIQMPVLKSSGMNNYGDIKGKKVNIGQAGSGSEATTLTVLKSFDIDLKAFTPQRLSHGNAADAVIDEKIDAYINIGGLGQSHQMKAMTTGKVKIVPMDPPDKRAKFLKEYPYYYEYTMPANAYPNQNYTVVTAATGTLLVTREDISEELVYQITKQLFENISTLEKNQSIAKEITLKDAMKVSGLTLHPGAIKYYKEVGVLK